MSDDGLMSAEWGGIRWLYAFTDEDALSRFVLAAEFAYQSRRVALVGVHTGDLFFN
ncbi:hypothetical protein [Streptomyces chrestomyceticus]|uniref:hypothetical protein n=1 Tax=Streptomyces chrestomyceticus TaxID=68185 RepID=UPI0037B6A475